MTSTTRPEITEEMRLEASEAASYSVDDLVDAAYDSHHIGLIHLIKEARDREKVAKTDAEMPTQILKSYLAELDEPVLEDGERGLRVRLQERSGTEWDLRNMPGALLQHLQVLGMLKVDNAMFDAMRRAAPATQLDDAAKFRRQITGSVALLVEEIK